MKLSDVENNLYGTDYSAAIQKRISNKRQKPLLLWLTGLSGSGKSTIAQHLEIKLLEQGYHTFVLDGDNVRQGLNKGLGFSQEDRAENLRRIAEVSKLMIDAGLIVIATFVSPLRSQRSMVQEIISSQFFKEVYINTPLEECERRDVKGLYKKARAGEIKNFTGIDSVYEEPINPNIEIKTKDKTIEKSVEDLYGKLKPLIENG